MRVNVRQPKFCLIFDDFLNNMFVPDDSWVWVPSLLEYESRVDGGQNLATWCEPGRFMMLDLEGLEYQMSICFCSKGRSDAV